MTSPSYPFQHVTNIFIENAFGVLQVSFSTMQLAIPSNLQRKASTGVMLPTMMKWYKRHLASASIPFTSWTSPIFDPVPWITNHITMTGKIKCNTVCMDSEPLTQLVWLLSACNYGSSFACTKSIFVRTLQGLRMPFLYHHSLRMSSYYYK